MIRKLASGEYRLYSRKKNPNMSASHAPGYSGKPLSAKIGLKDGQRVSLIGAPEDVRQSLEAAGHSIDWTRFPATALDCILLFAPDQRALEAGFASAAAALVPAGMLWVAWPKKASGVRTDLTEDRVRAHGLAVGLVDVKVCAVSEVWGGLKFVRRIKDR
ncbi:MAG TPA: DUF3052 domain-containing protein [Gemmatimonadales bacterium]|jgi:hypothetical protein